MFGMAPDSPPADASPAPPPTPRVPKRRSSSPGFRSPTERRSSGLRSLIKLISHLRRRARTGRAAANAARSEKAKQQPRVQEPDGKTKFGAQVRDQFDHAPEAQPVRPGRVGGRLWSPTKLVGHQTGYESADAADSYPQRAAIFCLRPLLTACLLSSSRSRSALSRARPSNASRQLSLSVFPGAVNPCPCRFRASAASISPALSDAFPPASRKFALSKTPPCPHACRFRASVASTCLFDLSENRVRGKVFAGSSRRMASRVAAKRSKRSNARQGCIPGEFRPHAGESMRHG